MYLVTKWMLFWNWETANNLWKNVMRISIIFLRRKIFLKIFTKRQQILLPILLPVLYYYFFIQSECLFFGKTEMYFNLYLLIAYSLLFAMTSGVLLSSVSWGIHCDKIWNCPQLSRELTIVVLIKFVRFQTSAQRVLVL